MSLGVLLSTPYYTGASTTLLVPYKFPVSLNGRPYILDLASDAFRHETVPLLRQPQDDSEVPGEQSINPEGLWRRSQATWHKGAGQTLFDNPDSDPARFRSSKGIDVWTEGQMSLLPDTDEKRASANTNLHLAVAGSYLYATDGAAILYTSDVSVDTPTFTSVTGGPAGAPTSIASDGYNVWTSHTANGIYATTRGAATTASYATGTVTLVGYVKGRLMAANANSIYNVTAAGALPAALFTHANTDFAWVGFAEGQGYLYAAGYSGDKSLIYKTAVKADGSALDVPIVAGELPDGEIIRAIQGYLGFVLLGTDKGVRFAAVDGSGNLEVGALISAGTVRCFEGQDRFVWFGWTNYDGTSTGLGRLDLSVFNRSAPAYASDLMVTGQGNVLSCVTFGNLRVLTVSGLGIYAQASTKVSTGTLDTGNVTYGIAERKVAMFLEVNHSSHPAGATHAASVAADSGSFTSVGTHTSSSEEMSFPVGEVRADAFEVRHTLTRATDTTTGPTVTRWTLKSLPAAAPDELITVPLLLGEELDVADGIETQDPVDELAAIKALRSTQDVVVYQEGTVSYPVIVRDLTWVPYKQTSSRDGWTGTCVVKLKVVA